MRIPKIAHTSRPWRIHELTKDSSSRTCWPTTPAPVHQLGPACCGSSLLMSSHEAAYVFGRQSCMCGPIKRRAQRPAERCMMMSADNLQLTKIPSVKVGMGIRRSPSEVFQALVDPAITTRFWFTKSSGKLVPGATVRWDWEMYGASAKVWVREVDDDSRIVIEWGDDESTTTVEFRFVPWGDDGTYVQVTETALSGDGDEVAARAADSTGGFTFMICALKALLEHDVVLTTVLDANPEGVEL